MEHQLVRIIPEWIPDWWVTLRGLVEKACERSGGRYEAVDVLDLALKERMQLWIVIKGHLIEAVVVTELVNYPRLKECRVLVAIGAKVDEWIYLVSKLEEWAKEQGCKKMLCVTRPGWEKILTKYGYRKTHVQLEKDI